MRISKRRRALWLLRIISALTFVGGTASHAASHSSIIGWDGDHDAVQVTAQGSLYIRDGREWRLDFKSLINAPALEWKNEQGYLPCLTSRYRVGQFDVRLRVFADQLSFQGNDLVVAYARVEAANTGSSAASFDPGADSKLTQLTALPSDQIAPGQTRVFDYAVAADRFARTFAWPSNAQLVAAGGWQPHFDHMKTFWDQKLAEVATLELPDSELANAYRAGLIYTLITKDGVGLKPGEFVYDYVYDHDAIGIAVTLFTQGHLAEGPAILAALPAYNMFDDARWKFPWPFAVYAMKSGDLAPARARWTEIRATMRLLHDARTGPHGILRASHALDTDGYWTVDDWSALTGLLAYRDLSARLGESAERAWADAEYRSLSASVQTQLAETSAKYGIDYLPCDIVLGPEGTRGVDPIRDANWAAPFLFGRYAWDGWLFGGQSQAEGESLAALVDRTYAHGFSLLATAGAEPHNFGSFGGYSTGYNGGYGAAALRGRNYRSEGIYAYRFMLDRLQAGPNAFWESVPAVSSSPLWADGRQHPTDGVGEPPHIWAQALVSKVLLDSFAAEFADGTLLLGRGLPRGWITAGKEVRVSHFPLSGGKHVDIVFHFESAKRITLSLAGDGLAHPVWLDLPAFLGVQSLKVISGEGRFDAAQGRLELPAGTRGVTVEF